MFKRRSDLDLSEADDMYRHQTSEVEDNRQPKQVKIKVNGLVYVDTWFERWPATKAEFKFDAFPVTGREFMWSLRRVGYGDIKDYGVGTLIVDEDYLEEVK